jgi:hypothetical protein
LEKKKTLEGNPSFLFQFISKFFLEGERPMEIKEALMLVFLNSPKELASFME